VLAFGLTKPLLVNEDSVLIAGHGRLSGTLTTRRVTTFLPP